MKAVQRRLISTAVIAAGAAVLLWAGLTFGPQLLAASSSSGSGSGERSEYRAGRDYFELDAEITESYTGDTDRIPARLFFWYGCSACYRTDPFFSVWAERHQDEIEWLHTPAVFSAQHENHARLYFAMQRLGIDREGRLGGGLPGHPPGAQFSRRRRGGARLSEEAGRLRGRH